jgi:2,5-dihydroxypyridine 5,6-dioxygenase
MVQFPVSSLVSSEALVLFREELALCRLERTEQVLIITDPSTNPNYVAACFGAALSFGAEVVQVVVPSVEGTPAPVSKRISDRPVPYQHIINLMKQMDFVADLSSRGFLHSERQVEILSQGTRMLRVREPIECLQRLFPTLENQRCVEASANILGGGTRFHVTTSAGTDFTVDRGSAPVFKQYGYAERRGRWDHWPTALAALAPDEPTARGTIVLVPGDFAASRYIQAPVHLAVEGGRLTRIEGGLDAVLIRDHLARGQGTDADRISHIGWGCDRRARWDALDRYEAYHQGGAEVRSVAGGVVIAFGSNADMGGRNRTQLHLDLGIRGARFIIDGRPVVDGETFLVSELC